MSLAAKNGVVSKAQNVPAWKRLGLKLKYAREVAEDGPQQQNQVETTQTKDTVRPNGNHASTEEPPAKKRRTLKDATSYANGRERNSTDDSATGDVENPEASYGHQKNSHIIPSADGEVSSKSNQRRKSVTFTPETKLEDGASASSSSNENIEDLQQVDLDVDYSQQLASSSKQSSKERKRAKRSRVKENDEPVNSLTEKAVHNEAEAIPDYVNYVELFHNNKQAWKFNKNKQTELLKNLFNTYRISSQHSPAVLEYIAGLQGAAARSRLIESATAVLKDIAEKESQTDFESMESEKARRTAYGAALKRQIDQYERSQAGRSEYDDQQLTEMRNEIERGKRAEAVLGELLQRELYPERSQTAQSSTAPSRYTNKDTGPVVRQTDTTRTRSKRRKRKSRTQNLSDESDSDSSDGTSGKRRGPSTLQEATTADPDTSKATAKEISPPVKPTGKKTIFDDDLLDNLFPKEKSYRKAAPKQTTVDKSKGKDFASTHGTRVSESDSEDDESS